MATTIATGYKFPLPASDYKPQSLCQKKTITKCWVLTAMLRRRIKRLIANGDEASPDVSGQPESEEHFKEAKEAYEP